MDLGRRSLPAVFVALGLTLAAIPCAAKTDPGASRARLDTTRVQIGSAESGTSAYVAWPAGQGSAPAVVVAHEREGFDGSSRETARRLAQQGYVVIVPGLRYAPAAASGDAGVADDTERLVADLRESIAWLHAQPRTAKSRIGVIGLGAGAELVVETARGRADLAVLVLFYGGPGTQTDRLSTLAVPLQIHVGSEDPDLTPDQATDLQSALRRAGKSADVFVYPGAGREFMHEGRPSFHPDAARQAWVRTLSFLQKNLKG